MVPCHSSGLSLHIIYLVRRGLTMQSSSSCPPLISLIDSIFLHTIYHKSSYIYCVIHLILSIPLDCKLPKGRDLVCFVHICIPRAYHIA